MPSSPAGSSNVFPSTLLQQRYSSKSRFAYEESLEVSQNSKAEDGFFISCIPGRDILILYRHCEISTTTKRKRFEYRQYHNSARCIRYLYDTHMVQYHRLSLSAWWYQAQHPAIGSFIRQGHFVRAAKVATDLFFSLFLLSVWFLYVVESIYGYDEDEILAPPTSDAFMLHQHPQAKQSKDSKQVDEKIVVCTLYGLLPLRSEVGYFGRRTLSHWGRSDCRSQPWKRLGFRVESAFLTFEACA